MKESEKLLDELGVHASLKGYQYWVDAIEYQLNIASTKQLLRMCDVYYYIAAKYDDTFPRVERALRHVIEVTPNIAQTIKKEFKIKYKLTNTTILIYLARLVEERGTKNEGSQI